VAGVLAAGANCAETQTSKVRHMDIAEFITFLEPRDATETEKEKGPAICQSSQHFGDMKTALEVACEMLKERCTYEMQQALKRAGEIQKILLVKP
jgi:hypothetical protein